MFTHLDCQIVGVGFGLLCTSPYFQHTVESVQMKKRCNCHRGVTDEDRLLHEQGVFGKMTASGIGGDDGAESIMSRRQLLIKFDFGGEFLCEKVLRCTIGTGTPYGFLCRAQHGDPQSKLEINPMVTIKLALMKRGLNNQLGWGHQLTSGFGRWWCSFSRWVWWSFEILMIW